MYQQWLCIARLFLKRSSYFYQNALYFFRKATSQRSYSQVNNITENKAQISAEASQDISAITSEQHGEELIGFIDACMSTLYN